VIRRKGKLYVMGIDQMILSLTKRMKEEGAIPTIAKIIDNGYVTQALSSFPCYTPNNWPVIATGANTGTHGNLGWFVQMPDGVKVPAFSSLGVNAEFIWDAAERQGLRSAVMQYVGSAPSRMKNGYIINGAANPIFGGCPYEIAMAEAYATVADAPVSGFHEIKLSPAEGWQGLPAGGPPPLETTIRVTAKDEADNRDWQVVVLGDDAGYNRAVICSEKDLRTAIGESRLREWSNWAFMPFGQRTGTVRFKVVELKPDGSYLKLYRSQIMPTTGYTEPDEIGPELIARFGPYQEHISQAFDVHGVIDYETCLEEAELQSQWVAQAALYLTHEKECDIFFMHWHFIDDVNHYHLGRVDPDWFLYDEAEAPAHWAKIRDAYQVLDRMFATLMEGVTEDDYVVIVADHGCSAINRMVYMERWLFDHGYLVFKDPTTPKTTLIKGWYDKIDWEKSKIWLHEGVFLDGFNIFINEQHPDGYKKIQADLITDLRTWIDPKTGHTVCGMVLGKREAELLGLWGDQLGDILVVLEAGYQMGKSEGRAVLEDNLTELTAGHARMFPTEESRYGTQKAIFAIAGPGIKKGYERQTDKIGHIWLRDMTPTLCHLLGIEPPAQSQGRIIYDILDGHNEVRLRPASTPRYEPTEKFQAMLERFFQERDVLSEEVVPC
jgi:predicted AlkP superfamily phosphohydrolase/phosphomutase